MAQVKEGRVLGGQGSELDCRWQGEFGEEEAEDREAGHWRKDHVSKCMSSTQWEDGAREGSTGHLGGGKSLRNSGRALRTLYLLLLAFEMTESLSLQSASVASDSSGTVPGPL